MFYIGQKIKCINNKNTPLVVGNLYTVDDVDEDSVLLKEFLKIYFKNSEPTINWFYYWHFQPLQEEKGDSFIEDFIRIDEPARLSI